MKCWLNDFYKENKDFREYLERFCRTGKYTVEQALELKMVENVALIYRGELKGWTE